MLVLIMEFQDFEIFCVVCSHTVVMESGILHVVLRNGIRDPSGKTFLWILPLWRSSRSRSSLRFTTIEFASDAWVPLIYSLLRPTKRG